MRSLLALSLAACSTFFTSAAWAEVSVEEPWVRATLAQQKATGAFMRLQSTEDTRLTGVSSPVAAVAEVHEMKLENDVMTMRKTSGIPLAAGKALTLKPGGYHIMLMDLHQPLQVGSNVPLTLEFETPQGQRYNVQVQAPVRALAGKAESKAGHHH